MLYLNSNIRVLPVTCVPIMYMPTDETRQDMPFGPGASKDASNVRLEPPLRLDSFVKLKMKSSIETNYICSGTSAVAAITGILISDILIF